MSYDHHRDYQYYNDTPAAAAAAVMNTPLYSDEYNVRSGSYLSERGNAAGYNYSPPPQRYFHKSHSKKYRHHGRPSHKFSPAFTINDLTSKSIDPITPMTPPVQQSSSLTKIKSFFVWLFTDPKGRTLLTFCVTLAILFGIRFKSEETEETKKGYFSKEKLTPKRIFIASFLIAAAVFFLHLVWSKLRSKE